MDALRGSFGAFGSMIRARSVSRMSQNRGSRAAGHGAYGRRGPSSQDDENAGVISIGGGAEHLNLSTTHGMSNLPRTQLYDAPVPRPPSSSLPPVPEDGDSSTPRAPKSPSIGSSSSSTSIKIPPTSARHQKIHFDDRGDIAHYYPSPGKSGTAVHEQRPQAQPQLLFSSPYARRNLGEPIEYDDEDPEPSSLPPRTQSGHFLSHGGSSLETNNPFRNPNQRNRTESDPFRDGGMADSNANLLANAADVGPARQEIERAGASSPEEGRRPFHQRTRAYPGGSLSSDEEGESRESLVAHDSGSTRGGVRLVPAGRT
jgi:hypothetical protein